MADSILQRADMATAFVARLASGTCAIGDLLARAAGDADDPFTVQRADAADEVTMPAIGVALNGAVAGGNVVLARNAQVRYPNIDDAPPFTQIGVTAYVAKSRPGKVSDEPPVNGSVQPIGITIDLNTAAFFLAAQCDTLDTLVHVVKGRYDFASGGAADTQHLFGPTVPENAQIVRAFYQIVEDLVGEGASISLGVGDAAAGIMGETAIAGLTDPFYANSDLLSFSAAGRFVVAITDAAAVTAGKIAVWVEYVILE